MLWDLVCQFMGSLPEEFNFLYAFGVVFVLYIVASIFKFFLELLLDYCKSL